MIPKGFFHAALAAFILLVCPAGAQDAGSMRLQFMTFPQTMEPLEVELLVGGGQVVKLSVPSTEISETVRVPILSTLVFGKTVLDKENKPSFDVYGRGQALSVPKQLIFLLRKGKEMSEGLEVRAISGDFNDFAGGKFLFVNAARTSIGGKAGDVVFSLKPGAHTILKPGLESNGRLSHVQFFYNNAGKAVPFFSSMWPVAEHYRSLIFFYNDPNRADKVYLHSFRDFLLDED